MLIADSKDERLKKYDDPDGNFWSVREETLVDSLRTALFRAETAEGQLCQARELLQEFVDSDSLPWDDPKGVADVLMDSAEEFLSSSTPCPHEEEMKRLRGVVEWAHGELNSVSPVAAAALAALRGGEGEGK